MTSFPLYDDIKLLYSFFLEYSCIMPLMLFDRSIYLTKRMHYRLDQPGNVDNDISKVNILHTIAY